MKMKILQTILLVIMLTGCERYAVLPTGHDDIINNTSLAEKKADSLGFTGLWIKIESAETEVFGFFGNGRPYRDFYYDTIKTYVWAEKSNGNIVFRSCDAASATLVYTGSDMFIDSLAGQTSADITIIDNNEIRGRVTVSSASEKRTESFRMVKLRASEWIDDTFGSMAHTLISDNYFSSGRAALTCYTERHTLTDEQTASGERIFSEESSIEAHCLDGKQITIYDSSSQSDYLRFSTPTYSSQGVGFDTVYAEGKGAVNLFFDNNVAFVEMYLAAGRESTIAFMLP